MNEGLQREAHLSRIEMESWLSGESNLETDNLKPHLAACSDCATRMARLQAQGERFRYRNPTFAALSARHRRPSWIQHLRRFLFRPTGPALAFVALTLAAVGTALWTTRPKAELSLSVKGSPSFLLFDSRQNLLDPRDTVHVRGGDTLQLAITTEAPLHYRIFSRAENGELSELMPLPGEADSLGTALNGVILPHSLVFYAPVRPEIILCVWSRFPLDWKTARAHLGSALVTPHSGVDSFQVVGIP
jgi:hypothetical protein